jgi:hypothetical protein
MLLCRTGGDGFFGGVAVDTGTLIRFPVKEAQERFCFRLYECKPVPPELSDIGQERARFESKTWPTTSQSNSIRSAAKCCFTLGFGKPLPFWFGQSQHFDIGGDVRRFDPHDRPVPCPHTTLKTGRPPYSKRAACFVAD